MLADARAVRPAEADEVARHQPGALVDQLVEGVLAVGARLAPDDRPGRRARPARPCEVDRLAVALHVELLEVGREAPQALAVGQHGVGLGPEEVRRTRPRAAPAAPACSRSSGAVRKCSSISVEAGEELAEALGADRDHQRQPDRRVDRVAAAHPVPEAEHVGGVDAERRDLARRWWRRRRSGARTASVAQRVRPATPRAVRALVSVSRVVKVFEETTNERRARGRGRSTASAMSAPSTLETKRTSDRRVGEVARAPGRPSPGRGPSRRCRC